MNPSIESAHQGPVRNIELRSKRTLRLPSRIGEQATISAFFAAPTREIAKLVPSRRLKLVELYPGTSLLCVACTEHSRIEGLLPYHEVSLLVPVRYSPRVALPLLPLLAPKLFEGTGYYVHRTFVSTREAQDVSVEVHGANATLCEIRFDEQPFWRRAVVQVDEKLLLTLDVRKSRGRHTVMTTYAYTLSDGHILRRPVPLLGELGFRRGSGAAKLALGEHYAANELRALKLATSPTVAAYAPAMESVLAAPDRVLAP
jgi:hypothetical protein